MERVPDPLHVRQGFFPFEPSLVPLHAQHVILPLIFLG